ncbi:MAG TPA: 16S rRNA (uracil(1498)-N(3))-methyltransferase [Bacteroidia bacterium]|jgi:16S rRNA (uracil1498-N3)-methyltransferase|nr:16S rRNA (uracil(1498)-N(3))-methyltransferase [Bacteroidia bacterium]
MHLFFVPDINGDTCTLGAEESHHCIKVLRLQAGEHIKLTDGKGGSYKAEIEIVNARACVLRIIEHTPEPAATWQLHVAIAPTKNIARIEWLVEKLTEIGITEFIPVNAHYSERKVLKNERLNKIVIEAMKQSNRNYLPKLHELCSYNEMLEQAKDFKGQKFVLHCIEKERKTFSKAYKKGENALILIGPEGDFHNSEVEQAIGNSFIPITLGNHRLRTETAALVAACTLHTLNE